MAGLCLLFLFFIFVMPLGAEPASVEIEVEPAEEEDTFFFEAPDLIIEVPVFEPRSFDEIFPSISRSQRRAVLRSTGLRYSFENGGSPMLIPASGSGIDLFGSVMQKNPSHIVEALVVVPYNERELDMLDIYNALGRIENIKDQTIPLRNGENASVFINTTRLESAQNRRPIPDPPPANELPYSETMYLRFTDTFIGSLFFRGDITMSLYGMTYSMTNFRDINYSIFRIMRSERISIIIYLEPINEGILVYSMSGFYLPGFIVNRMNLTPNINHRITVILNWITEGLRIQESEAAERDSEALLRNIIQNNRFNTPVNTPNDD